MRPGALLYDLASLLADPYVGLDFNTQLRLLGHYPDVPAGALETWRHQYPDACIQRLVQALGAYGRLSALPGTSRFASHIRPALFQLQAALNDVFVPMPSLQKFVQSMVGV
jgi:aminoglycoside/choline kinase family phosphotransferase